MKPPSPCTGSAIIAPTVEGSTWVLKMLCSMWSMQAYPQLGYSLWNGHL